MWSVYLLLCDQKVIYTGITNNISNRLRQHKSKNSTYTKKFLSIELIYREDYKDRAEAVKREREVKGWSKKKKMGLIKQ